MSQDSLSIQKGDATGGIVWGTELGEARADLLVSAHTVDSSGDLILGGHVSSDAFVTKLDGSTGERLWSARLNTAEGSEQITALAVDEPGNVLAVGSFEVSRSGGVVRDVFLTKLSGADGRALWTQRFGTRQHDSAKLLYSAEEGEIQVVVVTTGDLDGSVNTEDDGHLYPRLGTTTPALWLWLWLWLWMGR